MSIVVTKGEAGNGFIPTRRQYSHDMLLFHEGGAACTLVAFTGKSVLSGVAASCNMPVKSVRDDLPDSPAEDEMIMKEEVYCCYCRRYHPIDEVVRVQSSKGVKRWRCRKSIFSTRVSRDQRDAFGAKVTELNQSKYCRSLPHCIAELLGSAAARGAGMIS